MILTYKFKIKKNRTLDKISNISKNLYNQANYIIRNNFIEKNNYLNFYKMDKIIKNIKNLEGCINYKLLPAKVSQQILKLLDKNWKSFFMAIKDYSKNKSKYNGKPNLPGYIKSKQHLLIFTNQCIKINKNRIKTLQHNNKENRNMAYNINIRIPKYKDFTNFQQIRILPRKNYYEIEIIYEEKIKNNNLDKNKLLSIDLGINNFLTCTTNNKNINPFIINGRGLKSVNQNYNRKISKLKSIRTKGHNKKKDFKTTNRMNNLIEYRNNYIKDKMHQCSKFIINYCLKNNIGRICVGELTGMKNNSKLSKKSNQHIQQIPLQKFKQLLKYKCELNGIEYIEIDEAYTSKCSALDLEPIEKHDNYIGKRIKRGIFKSNKGLINADVNGSLNIMRKVLSDTEFNPLIDSRIWFNPIKIREINPNSFKQFLVKMET